MKKKKCFVIMPFSASSKEHTESYWTNFFKGFLKPAIENLGYSCERSKALPTNLVKNIIEELFNADLVLAVLTDFNANVWYELGIRHSLKPGTIMIIEKGQKIPFDTTHYGVIQYTDKITEHHNFEAELQTFIEGIEKAHQIDNPVQEFIAKKMTSDGSQLIPDFNTANWKEIFQGCKSLDIYVHYFDTFIRNHNDLFRAIFERGGTVRLILPNYNNNEVVGRILRRFPEYTLEEVRTKIKQTKYKVESIKKGVANPKSKFECFYVDEVGYYCGLKFNNAKLLISLYDHVRSHQKIESPTILFKIDKQPTVGKWFDKEFSELIKHKIKP